MNRIAGRAWALLLMIALLLGGTGFFLYEYVTLSSDWVMHTGSPHIYDEDGRTVAMGTVVDRDGKFLLNLSDKRTYSVETSLRMATIHWLGDRKGNISAPFLRNYAKEMTGYDNINGVYHYGGMGANATLTLSASVQTAALQALGDRKGTVAVYNYKTGEILCAVSTPTYDPDQIPDFSADTTGAYEG
ncbi:MAG: penicillin-binding protein, partial [Oscillospiraceae bacterium]|nr:penicillin-binding protein [Oscillospiraceae bacterium]